ncbi:hypothetical protein YC2023_011273 [Brassica napus]
MHDQSSFTPLLRPHDRSLPILLFTCNGNDHEHEHKDHVGDKERRKGMFQMSCNENTDCEILSAMDCESCLKSDAVTYCPLHNKLLCYYCDIKIHLPEPVPPLLELEIEVKATKKTDRRKFVTENEKCIFSS